MLFESVVCPRCTTEFESSATFCPWCGNIRTHERQQLLHDAAQLGVPIRDLEQHFLLSQFHPIDEPEAFDSLQEFVEGLEHDGWMRYQSWPMADDNGGLFMVMRRHRKNPVSWHAALRPLRDLAIAASGGESPGNPIVVGVSHNGTRFRREIRPDDDRDPMSPSVADGFIVTGMLRSS